MSDDPMNMVLAAINGLGRRLAGIEHNVDKRLAAVAGQVGAFSEQLDTFSEQLDTFSGQVGAFSEQLGALDKQVRALDERLTVVEKDVRSVRGETKSLRGEMKTMSVDLMGRMDRLQDAFSSMRNDIIVNFAQAERAYRIARATSDETRMVAEQVTAMQRATLHIHGRLDNLEQK